MKITIDIDCTPVEARQLVGLPDVQPMQERLMGEIEEKVRAALNTLTPDVLLQRWIGGMPTGIEQMKTAMEQLLRNRSGA
jgi:Family of unknown function (DUF6489)